jgi:hypothetical protein
MRLTPTWARIHDEHKRQSVCHERYYADETMEDTSFAGILLHYRDVLYE